MPMYDRLTLRLTRADETNLARLATATRGATHSQFVTRATILRRALALAADTMDPSPMAPRVVAR
jgi:uncharacterized protein (DUF1778 family)